MLFLFSILSCITSLWAQPPVWHSEHFESAGSCYHCHTAEGLGHQHQGEDVSPTRHWGGTMMSMSALDPYFLAKLVVETHALDDSSRVRVEDFCLRCHAPLGRFETHWQEDRLYSLEDLLADERGQDGVSCNVCHALLGPVGVDSTAWSGNILLNRERLIYGPFPEPETVAMESNIDMTPVESSFQRSGNFCAGCHMLFTDIRDELGELAGHFPEQGTWAEQANSSFADRSCQSCHMPVLQDSVIISNVTQFPWPRFPVSLHQLLGGNIMMLELFRDNAEGAGWPFAAEEFEEKRVATEAFLQTAAELDLEVEVVGDSLQVAIRVTNLTAHKLPTGIPLRRMWLEVLAESTESGEILLHSGALDWDGRIVGAAELEPHHQWIRGEQDVQVWEARMGNAAGEATWTLLEASHFVKDNRLLPEGWQDSGPWAHHTRPAGNCLLDDDFHQGAGGSDLVYLMLPQDPWQLTVRLHYQSVIPEAVDALRGVDHELVNGFLEMWDFQLHTSTVLAVSQLEWPPLAVEETEHQASGLRLSLPQPNPFNPQTRIRFQLHHAATVELLVHDLAGREVLRQNLGQRAGGKHEILLHAQNWASGIYLYSIQAEKERATGRLLLIR